MRNYLIMAVALALVLVWAIRKKDSIPRPNPGWVRPSSPEITADDWAKMVDEAAYDKETAPYVIAGGISAILCFGCLGMAFRPLVDGVLQGAGNSARSFAINRLNRP